jgi:hypothetical protein
MGAVTAPDHRARPPRPTTAPDHRARPPRPKYAGKITKIKYLFGISVTRGLLRDPLTAAPAPAAAALLA